MERIGAWIEGLGAADIAAAAGVALAAGAYLALLFGAVRSNGPGFPALNLAAALVVLGSLGAQGPRMAAVLAGLWAAISAIGLVRWYAIQRMVRLSPEEAAVVRILVPNVTKADALRVLRLGRIREVEQGLLLAEEGRPVSDLTVILGGYARIERSGQVVATVRAGSLVGEMTYRTGAPATATVRVEGLARVWQVEARRLRTFLSQNPHLAGEVEIAISGDLRAKLAETTRALAEVGGR